MNTQRKTHMKVDFHSFFGNKKMTGASFYLYLSTNKPRAKICKQKNWRKTPFFNFLKDLMLTFHWYLTDFILI